jgi:acetyl-CoA/propionyl-CoA carboxylase biotin carboxyl carrier protein
VFDTVLVANRGEIAVRVLRTLKRLGIRSVAIYSDEDEAARHVREADLALRVGPAAAKESYLNIERVVDAALQSRAQAIHPGYGFLSENASFVRACEQAGIVFIGPSVESVEMMGDKIRAKAAVAAAGVRVVPGRADAMMSDDELAAGAREVGYPVLLKPSAGGGGKGMRLVNVPEDLAAAIVSARRESAASFGDDTLFIERYVASPRHVEVQVLADNFGHAIHLGERECSLQRRHQKVIEEAPSPLLNEISRASITESALRVSEVAHYRGVGTVEFIVSSERPDEFFFMEMNTRLQVEHPVTEMVTGLDLVEQQIRVAAGERLSMTQVDVATRGHAIEARIYAEDPSRDFLPTGGDLLYLREPRGTGLRVDSSLLPGTHVGTTYDPMLAKIIAHGVDRGEALARLDRALGDLVTFGVVTNTAFLRTLLANDDVRAGVLDTNLIGRLLASGGGGETRGEAKLLERGAGFAVAQLLRLGRNSKDGSRFDEPDGWRIGEHAVTAFTVRTPEAVRLNVGVSGTWRDARVSLDDTDSAQRVRCRAWREDSSNVFELLLSLAGGSTRILVAFDGPRTWIGHDGYTTLWRVVPPTRGAKEGDAHDGDVRSPMPGVVIQICVSAGVDVALGDALLVVEAMKMEHTLSAPLAGQVADILVNLGDQVVLDQIVARVQGAVAELTVAVDTKDEKEMS